ncbi:MAG: hypothetical protein ABJV04_10450 [Aliiglaciecola sp.]|uniref:RipA family octameric membrane protein n=1 Tax=Aliiglaciecola sp. TaxID=1872441 RepID=UPI0032997F8B
MQTNRIHKTLYAGSKTGVDNYNEQLFEQYKIYLASADTISSRRQSANSFFVTLNTVLVSLISYLNIGHTETTNIFWLVSTAGIAICYMWYRLVRSYRDLNTAKFKVIHEIEKSLPLSPFDAEWEAVGRGEDSKLYLPFTHVEMYVPMVFIVLHLFVLVSSFVSF